MLITMLASATVAPAAEGEKTYVIEQGAALPPAAVKAADAMVAKGAGGFSVGVGVRGQVISLAHFGGIQPDTQYPIASASKFLTAATVMALVDDGTLQLDAPISTWLPKLPEAAGKLTLRQLLSQTSGLAGSQGEFYDLAQDHRITLEQSAMDVTKRPLVSVPGEVFAYGGPGFQVAGAVVEAATGKRWAQVFQEKIAGPLGMTRTYWTHLRLDTTEELPVDETLNPVLQGGAVSTARDYMRFLSMIAQEGMYEGKRVLSRSAIDELLKDQTPKATMTAADANPIKDAHYSLGNWCESWDETGAGLRNSSIGAFGVYPWVERKAGHFGIVFPYVRENAFRLWPEIEAIRDAVAGIAGDKPISETIMKSDTGITGAPYTEYPKGKPQLTVLRIKFPAHSVLPWHTHVVPNAAYVVSGHMLIEERVTGKKHRINAGEAFPESVGVVHRGLTEDEPAEVIVFYAGTKDTPLSVPVEGGEPEFSE
jgi:CubicO group peptidase (beta-lactamase class C family)/quercetin dioxygenase-like cupin family protein